MGIYSDAAERGEASTVVRLRELDLEACLAVVDGAGEGARGVGDEHVVGARLVDGHPGPERLHVPRARLRARGDGEAAGPELRGGGGRRGRGGGQAKQAEVAGAESSRGRRRSHGRALRGVERADEETTQANLESAGRRVPLTASHWK